MRSLDPQAGNPRSLGVVNVCFLQAGPSALGLRHQRVQLVDLLLVLLGHLRPLELQCGACTKETGREG